MKLAVVVLGFAALAPVALRAQMMDGGMQDGMASSSPSSMSQSSSPKGKASAAQGDSMMGGQEDGQAAPAVSPEQAKAAKAFADKSKTAFPPKVVKAGPLTPLPARERVVQLLDRFTFGARPGEVDRVMAMGGEKWLEQQLNPDAINDGQLGKALASYPTLTMTAQQAAEFFPDRSQVYAVADGRVPYPADPLLNAVYEVEVYKADQEKLKKKADGSPVPPPELTDEQKAAQKAAAQATASRIAGELFALPKEKRMAALIAMPVEDRVAFTNGNNLQGEQRTDLLADFTPRERDAFVAMAGQVRSSYNTQRELQEARILSDVLSERQLQQVMTDFWFNHFNVYVPKDSDQWYSTSYVRDVIRAHSLGTFKDLLLATAESPAMMVYLDNWLSIGPDSMANGVDPKNPNAKKGNKGLNENYGREVMELHTVGVTGGYSQADVTALAAILTGWGVQRTNQGGGFYFDPKRHEPGTKYWFGYEITDDGKVTKLPAGAAMPAVTFGPTVPGNKDAVATADSMKQGLAALNILASSPQTAHFISYMLAQYFIADEPPAAMVDRLAKVYLSSGGDIKTILRAIVASPEFNSKQYFHNKVKTPEEFIASSFRTTATTPTNAGSLVGQISRMGMDMYNALPPTGYYLTAAQWMSSTALVSRLNFSYNLTTNRMGGGQMFDAPKLLALGLMTATGAGSSASSAGVRPVAGNVAEGAASAKLIGFAGPAVDQPKPAGAATTAGAQMTLRVLESTVVGAPVSAQTNLLINKQLDQQPANANPVDTLNLITALVLGSPEFQLR